VNAGRRYMYIATLVVIMGHTMFIGPAIAVVENFMASSPYGWSSATPLISPKHELVEPIVLRSESTPTDTIITVDCVDHLALTVGSEKRNVIDDIDRLLVICRTRTRDLFVVSAYRHRVLIVGFDRLTDVEMAAFRDMFDKTANHLDIIVQVESMSGLPPAILSRFHLEILPPAASKGMDGWQPKIDESIAKLDPMAAEKSVLHALGYGVDTIAVFRQVAKSLLSMANMRTLVDWNQYQTIHSNVMTCLDPKVSIINIVSFVRRTIHNVRSITNTSTANNH
jgi:hypothetical protein